MGVHSIGSQHATVNKGLVVRTVSVNKSGLKHGFKHKWFVQVQKSWVRAISSRIKD